MSMIVVKVTYPSKKEADDSVRYLLERNLISSANIFPIKSISKWTGEAKEVDEILVLLKSVASNWEKIKTEIKKRHSYQVPCIIKFEVDSNEDYERWVIDQTTPIR